MLGEMEPLTPDQFLLEHLERMNLFLMRLDDPEGWYRYHHLFRQLLQHELRARVSREAVAALHRTASAWLARHGFIEEAIRHALTAEDIVGAAELVEAQVHPLMNQEHWRLLERYLSLLPADLVEQRPGLLVARAYIHSFISRLAAIPPLLQQAEALLDDPAQPDQRAIHGAIAGCAHSISTLRSTARKERASPSAHSMTCPRPRFMRAVAPSSTKRCINTSRGKVTKPSV